MTFLQGSAGVAAVGAALARSERERRACAARVLAGREEAARLDPGECEARTEAFCSFDLQIALRMFEMLRETRYPVPTFSIQDDDTNLFDHKYFHRRQTKL